MSNGMRCLRPFLVLCLVVSSMSVFGGDRGRRVRPPRKIKPTRPIVDDRYDDRYDNGRLQARPVRLNEYVGQRFRGENFLKVKRALRMNQNYDGFSVQSVSFEASTRMGRGRATLMINGHEVGYSQTVGTYMSRYTFRVHDRFANLKLGRGIRTIQIKMNGSFDVERVMATLVKHVANRTQTIRKSLFESYHGDSVIPVRNILGLGREFRGKKIYRVELEADSARGKGTAQLEINGSLVGYSKRLSTYGEKVVFMIPRHQNILGENIRSLKIRLRGNIQAFELSAVVDGRSRINPPRRH